MTIAGMPTTWQVKTGLGSLETCNTHWNARSIQMWSTYFDSWGTSPAWTPLCGNGESSGQSLQGSGFVQNADNPWAFCRQLVPGFIKRVSMGIVSNSLTSTGSLDGAFQIWLARDGPVNGGGVGDGTPILEKLIFNVPDRFDTTYSEKQFYPVGQGDTVLPLFSGHSYGYVWTTQNDIVPTGSIALSIMTSIMYGGAGS